MRPIVRVRVRQSRDNGGRLSTTSRQRGFSIYSRSDAVHVRSTNFGDGGRDASEDTRSPELIQELNDAGGVVPMVLMRQTAQEGGFSLMHLWLKPNYPLTRHSHDCACLYYVIRGQIVMGSRVLAAGDSFFVRADVPYRFDGGPEGAEVLEVRHGVEQFATKVHPMSPGEAERMIQAVRANLPQWKTMVECPTFAANPAAASESATGTGAARDK